MFRKVGQKCVISNTFRELFFVNETSPLGPSTHPINQISDICYGSGLFSGTVFWVAGHNSVIMYNFLRCPGGFLFGVIWILVVKYRNEMSQTVVAIAAKRKIIIIKRNT